MSTTASPAVRLPFETPNEYFDHRTPDQHYIAAIRAVWNASGLSSEDRLKIAELVCAANTEAWSKGYREHAETVAAR